MLILFASTRIIVVDGTGVAYRLLVLILHGLGVLIFASVVYRILDLISLRAVGYRSSRASFTVCTLCIRFKRSF